MGLLVTGSNPKIGDAKGLLPYNWKLMLEEWCNNCSWWHLKTTHNKLLIARVGGQNLRAHESIDFNCTPPKKKRPWSSLVYGHCNSNSLSLSPNNKPSTQAFQKWVVQTIATIRYTIIHHHTMCIHLHECISLRKLHISIFYTCLKFFDGFRVWIAKLSPHPAVGGLDVHR